MAKKQNPKQTAKPSAADLKRKHQRQVLFGGFLILIALLLILAFSSYLFSWKEDFSTLNSLNDREVAAQNLLNKLGAYVSHFFIYQGFGIASYFIPYLLFITGFTLFLSKSKERLVPQWSWGLSHLLWATLTMGFFYEFSPLFSGIVGYECYNFITDYIGKIGLLFFLIFTLL